MDAEGGQIIHRDTRSRRLAVVVVVQNVLVAACLAITAYVFWNQGRANVDGVHFQADTVADIEQSGPVKMMQVNSKYMMGLLNDNNDTFYTNCTGSYLLYLDVCYTGLGRNSSALLQLQVKGSAAPAVTFKLQASKDVCSELHGFAYLKVRQEVSLQLFITEGGFKIKTMYVDLNFLGGIGCKP